MLEEAFALHSCQRLEREVDQTSRSAPGNRLYGTHVVMHVLSRLRSARRIVFAERSGVLLSFLEARRRPRLSVALAMPTIVTYYHRSHYTDIHNVVGSLGRVNVGS